MIIIGVTDQLLSQGQKRMLDSIGQILGLKFENRNINDCKEIAAWIHRSDAGKTIESTTDTNIPCYEVIGDNQTGSGRGGLSIEFSAQDPILDIFRGRTVETENTTGIKPLPESLHNGEILASTKKLPLWVLRKHPGYSHHYVSMPIPALEEDQCIFEHFYGSNFISLLPLWLFLKNLKAVRNWQEPALKACFMIDDPNLHWRTYGFTNYNSILQDAKVFNYHLSFATIPIDSWYVHQPTAALFKENPDRLSLLIHGNDHILEELARLSTEEGAYRVLALALTRIRYLERRSNLTVSRVMVPPHGACNEKYLNGMARLGFEAACISRGSLRHYNSDKRWVRTIGMKPADTICGLTVFPRFRISNICHNDILIAALLRQPIIPVGHHYDLAEGNGILNELSPFINSLGHVQWDDLKGISRSLFASKIIKNSMHVRMYSKKIEIVTPDGIDEICIEPSVPVNQQNGVLCLRDEKGHQRHISNADHLSIPAIAGQKLEVFFNNKVPKYSEMLPSKKIKLWPAIRRILTETRDRIAPMIP